MWQFAWEEWCNPRPALPAAPGTCTTGSPKTTSPGAVASTVTVREDAAIDTLVRLGRAACMLGKMPGQCPEPAVVYVERAAALAQADRLSFGWFRSDAQSGLPLTRPGLLGSNYVE
jgi:hypothetical protein